MELKTVVGEADVRWKCGFGGGVVEIVAHVNEVGAAGLEPFDDCDGLVEMRVAGVRIAPERVEDEDVEVLKQGQTYIGDVAHVGEVGSAAEAIAGDLLAPVGYGDAAKTGSKKVDPGSGGGVDAVNFDARAGWVAVLFAEGVLEDALDALCGCVVGVDGQIALCVKAERPQIVESHDVVGVAVGVEHGVDAADVFAQGLRMKVRAGVDQDRVAFVGEPDRRSGAPVARVGRSADRAVAAEGGHSH